MMYYAEITKELPPRSFTTPKGNHRTRYEFTLTAYRTEKGKEHRMEIPAFVWDKDVHLWLAAHVGNKYIFSLRLGMNALERSDDGVTPAFFVYEIYNNELQPLYDKELANIRSSILYDKMKFYGQGDEVNLPNLCKYQRFAENMYSEFWHKLCALR